MSGEIAIEAPAKNSESPALRFSTANHTTSESGGVARWIEHIWRDLKYSLRVLYKDRRFSALAILTLALGIGANTVIFSVLDDLLIRPSTRDRNARIVALHLGSGTADRTFLRFTSAEFRHLQESTDILSSVAAQNFSYVVLGRIEEARQTLFCSVSAEYFSILGVRPLQGRFFTSAEAQPDSAANVLVASYSLWRRLGARPDFVGSQLIVDGRLFEVIGIAPRGFGGLQWAIGPEAWMPLGARSALNGGAGGRSDVGVRWLNVIASLRPGLTVEQALPAANLLTSRLQADGNDTALRRRELSISSPSRSNLDLTAPTDESAFGIYAAIAMGLTVTVLLVASLNVANMLLARGTSRRKEIAIRLAVGASRARLVTQLLVEGAVLAIGGGVVGLLITWVSRGILLGLMKEAAASQKYVIYHETTLHVGLFIGAFVACLVTTLLCSLGPAVRATRVHLVDDLKQQAGEPAEVGAWNRFFSLRHCVVMLQVSLSLVLLVCAGLLARCAIKIESARGFASSGMVANFNLTLTGAQGTEIAAAHRALLRAARQVPGVEAAAIASSVPYNYETTLLRIFSARTGDQGSTAADSTQEGGRSAVYTTVSSGYFNLLQIPIVRGRDFSDRETFESDAPRVAIIDEQLARALFPSTDPIGRRIVSNKADADGRHPEREMEVVGIIRSPREHPISRDLPMRIYRPMGQVVDGMTYVHIQMSKPGVSSTSLRRELIAAIPGHPLLFLGPLSSIVDHNLDVWSIRLAAVLFAVFGGVALFLTITGVYGVKAYAVTRRTREFGIRIALGASVGSIIRLVVKQGLLHAGVGLAVGLAISVMAGISLSKLLVGVPPLDLLVLPTAILVLLVAVLGACVVPALRAAKVRPSLALRAE